MHARNASDAERSRSANVTWMVMMACPLAAIVCHAD